MRTGPFRTLALAALVAAQAGLPHGLAAAQGAARPDPADPKTASPMPDPGSAYAGYRRYAEEPNAPWREVNDEVARVGGHAGALKGETASPDAAPAASQSGAGPGTPSGGVPGRGGGHGGRRAPPENKQ